jgi:hypothetical protein
MVRIQNPGSALGEAIGLEMEKALNDFLTNLVEKRGYHFLSKSPVQNKDGKQKKLFMYDKFGTAYNIDAVIANESLQPIILIESKYIRYTKHNRDKASWVCTAHPAIRRRYESIRSSIAVLAGSWSSSSMTMMKTFDINLFLINFRSICDLLANQNIAFDWDEKDRLKAIDAWNKYSALTSVQKSQIGVQMINIIKSELEILVLSILDDTLEREIDSVMIELHSNLGEVKAYEFSSIEKAVEFLNITEFKQIFITSDSITLFDPPPSIDDDLK